MLALRPMMAAAAASLVVGCGLSQPITKQKAGTIIERSSAFTRPKFAHIPRELTYKRSWTSPYGQERLLSISDLAHIDAAVAILKLQRLISVEETIYGPGTGAPHLLVINPSKIDNALLMADEDPSSLSGQELLDAQEERPYQARVQWNQVKRQVGWRVPIGIREFIQVDQIHNWRDASENIPVNELAIDFTWRWKPNDFGDPFDSESSTFAALPDSVQEAAQIAGVRMNTSAAMHSRAFFKRVGSEWQLQTIDWSVGRGNPR